MFIIDRRMEKQNTVYGYDGPQDLGWNSDTCYNIDELWGSYAKLNKQTIGKKQNAICFYLNKISRTINFI